jgi:hypothetical protein
MKSRLFFSPIVLFFCLLFSGMSFGQAPLSNAGKIWFDNDYLYVNIVDQGVLVIDNRNPRAPRRMGFIDIPGNVDMAVNGTTMYANSYQDLVTIDLSNLQAVRETNRIKGVFTHRRASGWGDNGVAWRTGDNFNNFWANLVSSMSRTQNINSNAGGNSSIFNILGINGVGISGNGITPSIAASANPTTSSGGGSTPQSGGGSGKGGSMACFSLKDNYLYAIDSRDIHIFDLASPQTPLKTGMSVPVNVDIETIFSYNNQLYIGSQSGMYIYDITTRTQPTRQGVYKHTRSCDPVVVEGDYAYVTMRNGTDCRGDINQLDVVDVKNPSNPQKLKEYKMTNPHGLGIDAGVLFVCDGRDGLKVFNAEDPRNLRQVGHFRDIQSTYDVIPNNQKRVLMMVGSNKIVQYDYSNINKLEFLSDFTVVGAN